MSLEEGEEVMRRFFAPCPFLFSSGVFFLLLSDSYSRFCYSLTDYLFLHIIIL